MDKKIKVGRNDPCPCGSIKKFKQCCEGKIDWTQLLREKSDRWKRHLSVRGKNELFLQKIFEALQFDNDKPPKSLLDFKSAFTPKAVKLIHEAVIDLWPPDSDIASILQSFQNDVSGLYVGEYLVDSLIRGVTRHSLYADKILLVDPFVYPLSVRDQFNPILEPEQYRTQTLKNVDMWMRMSPWIEAGMVEFIRTPADFDRKLNWDSMMRQKQKFEDNKELKMLAKEFAKEKAKEYIGREGVRIRILSAPDDYLRRIFRKFNLGKKDSDEDAFISYVHDMRKKDPYYLEPLGGDNRKRSELLIYSTGTSYDIARFTANFSNSYLITDIPSKWKEIELDRQNSDIDQSEWSPLAKAFQNLNLRYLNNVELSHALSLRKENRLKGLRTFLRRIWSAASSGNPFGEHNIKLLADELEDNVNKAENEWKQIDRDLMKWLGGEAAAGMLAGGPLIANGHGGFLAAAFATAGCTTLMSTYLTRKGFPDKYPAAFFMDIRKKQKD
ncbi:MAG: SEC-C metal-binding domain-containing protein [bacterium]